jgi:rhamnosyltransferase subunit B
MSDGRTTPRRIVITSFGSYGDVNPYVGLALALRARGHTPVIATSPFYRPYVEREGIRFHPVRPDVDPNDRQLVARIMDPARGSEYIVRDVLLPSLREAHDDLWAATEGADVVVTHPITFHAPLVAQERKLPWVSTVLAPMSFFSSHDLPVFPPMPWARRLDVIPGAARLLVSMARRVTRAWMEPVRALRASRGLPPAGDPLYEGQHSPQLVLALFSRLIATPQPDWPARVRITGPVWYNGPGHGTLAPELEAFLAAGPPPVVFTLGSAAVSVAGDFYEQSAAAARRAGMRAVLLVGAHEQNRRVGSASADVLVVEHAPHHALMPRAAATVHQGGAGTLHQALRAGRPMLVVPFAHDQPDNAYRAARLGVARTLAPSRYRADRAADALRRLLDDPQVVRSAAQVGEAVRGEGGAEEACDAIEALVRGDAR